MAFPVVSTFNHGNDTTGTSHTVNLPSGINSGDLLIVIFASDGNPSFTWPSGWNQAENNLLSGTNGTAVKLEAKQRIADGTEGSTITVTTGASEWTAHITCRVTGWHGSSVAEGSTTTGSSSTADPPSFNPTGWDVEDTLWIACAARDTGGTDNDDITGHPGSYTGISIELAGTSAGGVNLAASRRDNATASENPGTYASPTTEEWVSGTIAIRPVGGFTGSGALSVPQPALAGTGAETYSATGTLSVPQPQLSGSGLEIEAVTGSGALSVPAPSLAGTGSEIYSSTGALSVTAPVFSGNGTQFFNVSATGALSVTQPSLAGTGFINVAITATGALSVPAPSLSGSGQEIYAGSGAMNVTAPSLSGAGSEIYSGTGALGVVTLISGTGSLIFTGSGALTVPQPLFAGGSQPINARAIPIHYLAVTMPAAHEAFVTMARRQGTSVTDEFTMANGENVTDGLASDTKNMAMAPIG